MSLVCNAAIVCVSRQYLKYMSEDQRPISCTTSGATLLRNNVVVPPILNEWLVTTYKPLLDQILLHLVRNTSLVRHCVEFVALWLYAKRWSDSPVV